MNAKRIRKSLKPYQLCLNNINIFLFTFLFSCSIINKDNHINKSTFCQILEDKENIFIKASKDFRYSFNDYVSFVDTNTFEIYYKFEDRVPKDKNDSSYLTTIILIDSQGLYDASCKSNFSFILNDLSLIEEDHQWNRNLFVIRELPSSKKDERLILLYAHNALKGRCYKFSKKNKQWIFKEKISYTFEH